MCIFTRCRILKSCNRPPSNLTPVPAIVHESMDACARSETLYVGVVLGYPLISGGQNKQTSLGTWCGNRTYLPRKRIVHFNTSLIRHIGWGCTREAFCVARDRRLRRYLRRECKSETALIVHTLCNENLPVGVQD